MSRKPHRYLRGELVVVIDCSDLDRSADFWAAVLGYAREGDGLGQYLGLFPADGEGAEVLLQQVPDNKHDKNRMHLDLRTPDLEPEVRRVVGLGAAVTGQPLEEFGWRWQVLADPDGNEFCVVQPPDDYQPQQPGPGNAPGPGRPVDDQEESVAPAAPSS
jgi:predicted enzyme related to lactoylglutathione lyase